MELRRAIAADEKGQEFIGNLVNNAKDKSNPGFVRAVRSSPKLSSIYASNIGCVPHHQALELGRQGAEKCSEAIRVR